MSTALGHDEGDDTMSLTKASTISRRDAVVAAALSGAVLVILGYASGWGLTTTTAQAADLPIVQPTAPPATELPQPDPTPAAPIVPAVPVDPQPAVPAMSMPATSTPTTPATTAPTPTVTDPDKACKASLLESLGVDLPVTKTVTSLLSSVVGTTSALTGSATTDDGSDPLTCLVGSLIGPSCCGSSTVTILGGNK